MRPRRASGWFFAGWLASGCATSRPPSLSAGNPEPASARPVENGYLEPPHGGGNIHVQAPFSLEVVAVDDET